MVVVKGNEHVVTGRGTCAHGCLHVAVYHGDAVERLRSLAPVLFSGGRSSCYGVQDNGPRGTSMDTGKSIKKRTQELNLLVQNNREV